MNDTDLGPNQRTVLGYLADDRPYPGGGWIWDNHSTTVRLLEPLWRRGLVDAIEGTRFGQPTTTYKINEKGREAVA